MTPVDLSTFYTRAKTCERLGFSLRTLDRMVVAGSAPAHAKRKRAAKKPELVFDPADVEAMAAAAEKPPVIMPKASLEERAIEVRNAREPGTAMTLLRELMQRPAPAPPRDTLWVTVAEASAESGLSETLLHRLIAKELLPAIKDRGWKVRRADLANIDSGLVSLLSCGTMICGSVS